VDSAPTSWTDIVEQELCEQAACTALTTILLRISTRQKCVSLWVTPRLDLEQVVDELVRMYCTESLLYSYVINRRGIDLRLVTLQSDVLWLPFFVINPTVPTPVSHENLETELVEPIVRSGPRRRSATISVLC